MTSIKIKFRPSVIKNKEGVIYYQVIHNRVVRQLNTKYLIFVHEWNEKKETLIIDKSLRQSYLSVIQKSIEIDLRQLYSIINQIEQSKRRYSADDIITKFLELQKEQSLFNFMQRVITLLRQMKKYRTSEAYMAALRSFMRFREDRDILLDDINSDLIQMYEAYLSNKGVTRNSISFYMRILRAVYNRAVDKEIIINQKPFKHVYTGIDKTIKRALPFAKLKLIKNLDLLLQPSLDFARDIFLFSFYTRGMSFVDIAYLKKRDISNGILSYRRRKTGQQLFIRWEPCMQEIVDKYDNSLSEYLLPIINPNCGDERRQYQNTMVLINRRLKKIGKMIDAQLPLTMYTARHSWASVAKNKNIPISVISEGMGHDSEKTTQIYLASLETSVVDDANAQILKDL